LGFLGLDADLVQLGVQGSTVGYQLGLLPIDCSQLINPLLLGGRCLLQGIQLHAGTIQLPQRQKAHKRKHKPAVTIHTNTPAVLGTNAKEAATMTTARLISAALAAV
jgi:hypothetical protein